MDVVFNATPFPKTMGVSGIASNYDTVIGAVATLAEYYATGPGGRCIYNATTPVQTVTGTTEMNFLALVNPVASGVDVFVDRINTGANSTAILRRYRSLTLSALPTAQTGVNRGGGDSTAKAMMYAAGYSRTGGKMDKTSFLASFTQDANDVSGSIVLRPGDNLVWTLQGTAALSSFQAAMEIIWWELPARP